MLVTVMTAATMIRGTSGWETAASRLASRGVVNIEMPIPMDFAKISDATSPHTCLEMRLSFHVCAIAAIYCARWIMPQGRCCESRRAKTRGFRATRIAITSVAPTSRLVFSSGVLERSLARVLDRVNLFDKSPLEITEGIDFPRGIVILSRHYVRSQKAET